MSNNIKKVCETILGSANALQESVSSALETYRQERKQAEDESKQYKAEFDYFRGKQKDAAEKARSAVDQAEKTFRGSLKTQIERFKDELQNSIVYKLNPDFVSTLRLYNDFNIQISRTEIETLVNLANGNKAALTALNKVLEHTETPYKVSFTPLSEYERNIALLERRTVAGHFIPEQYHSEGVEIYKDIPVTFVNDDLSTYESGRMIDGISLISDRASFTEAMKAVENAMNASDTVCIVPNAIDNTVENVAKEIGKMRTEADRAAKEGLGEYLE